MKQLLLLLTLAGILTATTPAVAPASVPVEQQLEELRQWQVDAWEYMQFQEEVTWLLWGQLQDVEAQYAQDTAALEAELKWMKVRLQHLENAVFVLPAQK